MLGKHDEYVVESLISQDKVCDCIACGSHCASPFAYPLFCTRVQVGMLVRDLLVCEVWKEKVFPLLKDRVPDICQVKAYLMVSICPSTVICCNLLHFFASGTFVRVSFKCA